MLAEAEKPIAFQCNICGADNTVPLGQLSREEPSCGCGSTVRMRAIIQVLTSELFGESMAIADIAPPRPDIVGIGMSCWDGYAIPLAHRIAFKNTYYHQEPRLDITAIEPEQEQTLDFIVSTDVYEHVAPPVSIAFANARRLLKPDGVFIFTVPYFNPGKKRMKTIEHFPDLHDYELQNLGSRFRMKNVTRSGKVQLFDDLVFHGGPGTTLEMRVFSEWSMLKELRRAGFNDLTIYSQPDWKYGVYWPLQHSLPVAARVSQNRRFWQMGASVKHR